MFEEEDGLFSTGNGMYDCRLQPLPPALPLSMVQFWLPPKAAASSSTVSVSSYSAPIKLILERLELVRVVEAVQKHHYEAVFQRPRLWNVDHLDFADVVHFPVHYPRGRCTPPFRRAAAATFASGVGIGGGPLRVLGGRRKEEDVTKQVSNLLHL